MPKTDWTSKTDDEMFALLGKHVEIDDAFCARVERMPPCQRKSNPKEDDEEYHFFQKMKPGVTLDFFRTVTDLLTYRANVPGVTTRTLGHFNRATDDYPQITTEEAKRKALALNPDVLREEVAQRKKEDKEDWKEFNEYKRWKRAKNGHSALKKVPGGRPKKSNGVEVEALKKENSRLRAELAGAEAKLNAIRKSL